MEPSAQNSSENIKHTLWNSIVYDGFLDIKDPFALRQVFFINTFALLGFLAVFTFGTLHFLEKNYHVALLEIIGGVVFLLNILFLRLSKNISVSKVLLLLTLGVLLIVMLATGGTAKTGIFWFFTFPISVFFLMGRYKGILWIAFLYIATLLLFILSTFNLITFAYSFIEIRQLLASLLIVTGLIYLYQNSIEKSEETLKQRTTQLEITKRAIEQEKVIDEALLASLGEGMVTIASSGRILIMNDSACKMFGIVQNTGVGQDIRTIFRLKDINGNIVPDERRPWYLAIKGQKNMNEYKCVRNDGSEFPLVIIAAPVILNGQIIAAIELFRDIREEKKFDSAKSEFIALASHQLRTPISGISWFTEMLLNGDSGPLNEEQKDHLTKVYQSNERMSELVTALLYVSQVELGKIIIKPEPVNLVKMSHSILQEELKTYQTDKKLSIQEQYDQNLQPCILDAEIMKIVFKHLFSNAIKYTRDNGRISVSISLGQNSMDPNNLANGVVIKVEDTGIGIPKDQVDKIFLKLFRGNNARKVETDGTGIGLYIVKAIIEQIGGKIWFTSEENKGTTFFIWLPKDGIKN